MKIKMTNKAVKESFSNLRYCSYCRIQTLLDYYSPIAYTEGVYGWNYDVYRLYGLTICTGYRGMPGKHLECCDDFENKALALYSDPDRKNKIEELLHEFCKLNGGY